MRVQVHAPGSQPATVSTRVFSVVGSGEKKSLMKGLFTKVWPEFWDQQRVVGTLGLGLSLKGKARRR